MAVDATNLDGLTVNEQLPSGYLNVTEAHLLLSLFYNGTIGTLQLQVQGVEVRMLSRPQAWVADLHLHAAELTIAALGVPLVHAGSLMLQVQDFVNCNRVAAYEASSVQQVGYKTVTLCRFAAIDGELRIDSQCPSACIVSCADGNIAQADIRGVVEQHITMDAAKAPEVLVF